ncbi:Band 7 protein [Penicillium chrysogenum]|nr:Band 7 protein [Penicillium chrysogenum]
MSENGANTSKAPATGRGADRSLVDVQPFRMSDLQPKYAHQIDHAREDNPDAHGWYAGLIHGLVDQGEVGLISRFGRFERSVDPGLVKINPLSEHIITVDVKIQIVEVPRQICMTKDNVTLNLTSVIYYQVVSPHKTAFGISDVRQALVERTQTTLRHVIGARVLQDVIERREEIAQSTSEIIEEVAAGWGVKVESMLIKDIIFSNDLQDSLSMAAQSKRIGESKVIAARAEVESAKLMRQAADILSSAPAMQIRYLEAMQAMAKTANSKLNAAENFGEGPSKYGATSPDNTGLQHAASARVVEDI